MAGSAPVSLTGLFGASSSDSEDDHDGAGSSSTGFCNESEVSEIDIGGVRVNICQTSWHQANANQIWPGTYALAEFLFTKLDLDGRERYTNSKALELGAATGALAAALTKTKLFELVTSDIDDNGDVETSVRENFIRNGLEPCLHITHTWGREWPSEVLNIRFIFASDILLYVKEYPALVQTLTTIFAQEPNLVEMVMAWKRRIKDASIFFALMKDAGFQCHAYGKGLYSFYRADRTDAYLQSLEGNHNLTDV